MPSSSPSCDRARDRAADPGIGAAATDGARERGVDVGVAWARVVAEEGGRREDHPGLAVAALGHVFLEPGALEGMAEVRRQALDRDDGMGPDLRDGELARADGASIQMNGARSADAGAASELGAGEGQVVA